MYIERAMAFHISDPATDEAVRRLAKATGKGLTETVRAAVESEYRRVVSVEEKIRAIQERLRAKAKPGGKPADKAFYNDLSGDF